MAYIVPDSELQFFYNVGIDPDHENSIYFPTEADKDSYFTHNLPHISVSRCYYQREERGWCRVELPMSQMYNKTYMRFKNTQFENKWFYAFIDSVEYINNTTTKVNYTIDKFMTWMGAFTLDPCYIQRQHTLTDAIGDNIVPEEFDTSDTIHNIMWSTPYFSDWTCLIVASPDPSTAQNPANFEYGFYTALYYIEILPQNVASFLANMSSAFQERVMGIYYIPKDFSPTNQNIQAPAKFQIGRTKPIAGRTTLDGYTPKNNKLYTFPFYKMVVKTTEGAEKEYAYELSKRSGLHFELRGIVGERTQIALIPYGYNTPNDTDYNYTEALNMTEFPMCGWNIDTYKAYLAQQMVNIPANIGNAFLSAGVGMAMGGPAGALVTGVGSLSRSALDLISGAIKTKRIPYEHKGNETPQLALAKDNEYKNFYFFDDSIRAYQARIIDDYFTMFGYAINNLDVPNMCARPYYTYIKTIGCHLRDDISYMPSDDLLEIEGVFNNGVRLWNGTELATNPLTVRIGDYSLNNAPVAPTP